MAVGSGTTRPRFVRSNAAVEPAAISRYFTTIAGPLVRGDLHEVKRMD